MLPQERPQLVVDASTGCSTRGDRRPAEGPRRRDRLPAEPPRLRRTADDRRAQLVQIGLELLPTTPVQELTIDEVARRAGISRSLLFHYFATKREYYTAVTRAAADLLLRAPAAPAGHLAGRSRSPGCSTATWLGGDLPRDATWRSCAARRGGDPWVRRSTRRPANGSSRWRSTALGLPDDPAAASWCARGSPSPRTSWVSGHGSRRCPAPELLALLRDVLDRLAAR